MTEQEQEQLNNNKNVQKSPKSQSIHRIQEANQYVVDRVVDL